MEASVILCDYAQVHAGKLYIVGAPINLVGTPSPEAPHPINLAAGVLVTIPWNSHNQAHRLKVSLVSEDGSVVPIAGPPPPSQPIAESDRGSVLAQFNAGRSPMMQPGEDSIMPLAVPLNVQLPSLGGYSVIVEIDGAEKARARFQVAHQTQILNMRQI